MFFLDCSRFWECISTSGELSLCLYDCYPCPIEQVELCDGQSALTFDPSYSYPLGPVCDWPANVDCKNGHRCSPGEECDHVQYCGRSVEPGYCEFHDCCSEDSDCVTAAGCYGLCDTDHRC